MIAVARRSLIGSGLLFALPAGAASGAPDIIIHSARIWCGKTQQKQAQALAIKDGRITAVGSNADILPLKDKNTRLIDAGGRRIIPGINDAHDHAGGAAPGIEVRTQPPAEADAPLEVLVAAIAKAVATAPAGQWIFATAGVSVMGNPAQSLRAIEAASQGHPVAVMAWWGHGVLLNATAQAWAGMTNTTPDPLGGWLDRDAQGQFTGRLDEYAGAAVWRRLSTIMPPVAHTAAFRTYAESRLKEGVTSLQLMTTSQTPESLARTVIDANSPLKVRLVHFVIPAEDGVIPLKARRLSPTLRLDGIKYIVDGTPIDQFAYRSADYAGRPGWRGRLNFDQDFLTARLTEALAGDQQLLLHVVGDASATTVLDLMEALAPASAWRAKRLRLEHGNGVTGSNIERALALGVIIAQGRPTSPYKSWVSQGLHVAYGSDTGFGPWMMFKAMTAATNPQAVGREDALNIMTLGSAWAEFQETEKGCLAPGLRADFAVLSQDVLECPDEDLDTTRSLLTVIDGKVVYADAALA